MSDLLGILTFILLGEILIGIPLVSHELEMNLERNRLHSVANQDDDEK